MGGCSGPELGEPSRTPAGGAAAEEIHTEKPASWRQPAEELERERERESENLPSESSSC